MAAYCRGEGLTTSGFGYWKRQLEQQGPGPEATEGEIRGVRMARVRRRCEEAEPASGSSRKSLRLMVGRATVEVPAGFDAATLVQVLEVLETRGMR